MENSNRSAEEKFSVEPKHVRELRENFKKIITTKSSKQWLEGGGRKCFDPDLEEKLVAWVYEQRGKMLHVSRKMIMLKAKRMFDDENEYPVLRENFVASRGWCEKFMTRHGFSLRRKTTTSQKDPSFLVDRIFPYVIQVRWLQKQFSFFPSNIIGTDETPIWHGMISNTTVENTGAEEVSLKSAGNEKVRVSVCFTCKADATKCKPFIMFAGAKRESKALHKVFKRKFSIVTLVNGWINELLT